MNQACIYFWKISEPTYGCFSNWFHSPFSDNNNNQFGTAEHYLMYRKALLMGDQTIANQILQTHDPKLVKDLGRKVRNWDEATWELHRERIMFEAIYAKCMAHPAILQTLLGTGDKQIAEASPYDTIWGIGITAAEANRGTRWRGLNLLGESLMAVRSSFQEEQEN